MVCRLRANLESLLRFDARLDHRLRLDLLLHFECSANIEYRRRYGLLQ